MRLCIADPPYLGRSAYYDGSLTAKYKRNGRMASADSHPDAHLWDDPETHNALVARLCSEYDGWAIAMSRDSLPLYLTAAPTARVCVWHNPAAWPPGNRIHATWEPVLVQVPSARRASTSAQYVKDVLTAVPPRRAGFIGAKPREWTRWVLDMLGYDPETDTVDDLFAGSGAVAAEIAQGVLDFGEAVPRADLCPVRRPNRPLSWDKPADGPTDLQSTRDRADAERKP